MKNSVLKFILNKKCLFFPVIYKKIDDDVTDFLANKDIEEINIPNTLCKDFGVNTFKNCHKLKKIVVYHVPLSKPFKIALLKGAVNSFENCISLNTIEFSNKL